MHVCVSIVNTSLHNSLWFFLRANANVHLLFRTCLVHFLVFLDTLKEIQNLFFQGWKLPFRLTNSFMSSQNSFNCQNICHSQTDMYLGVSFKPWLGEEDKSKNYLSLSSSFNSFFFFFFFFFYFLSIYRFPLNLEKKDLKPKKKKN